MKSLLSTLFLFLSLSLLAQTHKGTWMTGRSFFNAFQSHTRSESSMNYSDFESINFNPELGYFVSDKIVVGASLNFRQFQFGPGGNFGRSKDRDMSFNPFARFYFNLGKTQVFSFVRSSLRNLASTSSFDPGEWRGETRLDFFGGFGLSHFLSPNLAIEGIMEWHLIDGRDPLYYLEAQTLTRFTIDLGIKMFINAPDRTEEKLSSYYLNEGNYVLDLVGGLDPNFNEFEDFGLDGWSIFLRPTFRKFIKNNLEIGGTLGGSYTKQNGFFTFKNKQVNLAAQAHYYLPLTENLYVAPGLSLSYDHTSSDTQTFDPVTFNLINVKNKANHWNATTHLNLLLFAGPKTIFRMGGNVTLGSTPFEQESVDPSFNSKIDQNQFRGSWNAGIEYFFYHNLSLYTSLNFNFTNEKRTSDDTPLTLVDSSQSTGLNIILRYFLRKK